MRHPIRRAAVAVAIAAGSLLPFATPASATHENYCGHGTGPTAFHYSGMVSINNRMVWIFGETRPSGHYHDYDVQNYIGSWDHSYYIFTKACAH